MYVNRKTTADRALLFLHRCEYHTKCHFFLLIFPNFHHPVMMVVHNRSHISPATTDSLVMCLSHQVVFDK